jgi:RNA polymerase sigma factor (sigma-70 family)
VPDSAPDKDADLEWAWPIIEREVRVFVAGSGVLNRGDEEDLVAEVVEHWLRQRHRYVPGRGASRITFLKKVCKNKLIDLRRAAEARIRHQSARELDDLMPGTSEQPDHELIFQELRDRLRLVYGQLPTVQRRVVDAIIETESMTDAAKRLGVSRPALHRRLVPIRAVFRDAGLHEYLD